ncbi:hypothetical protein PARPLA_00359 [Rhodobacteraceae bacterium THAF1]|uniref:FkbM family methyltransferase n=1 Tax=Palleronia sp. THAF1 TaxID=2587842 RepID=UPI000F3D1A52|nr:FkbM family methyltransferase [Palleronia sp. THAF1]QFU10076.1 hypothetical protein FIU81_15465 [Palleronia sp. THAF1]VDC17019.1 hypothetical protein PARPLA_00359 [Rhodobacteraceae bacterium THAF1]
MSSQPAAPVENQKSLALRIKGAIGHKAWRHVTRPVAWALNKVPQTTLYSAGVKLRRTSFPYSVLSDGDVAIQVGAPRDLLKVGRIRAVYFAMMVGPRGRLFIFEPEPNSAADMEAYLKKAGLADRVTVIAKGCWTEERVLRFWSNPNHAASNLLEDVSEWDEAELRERGYQPSEVPVTTIDKALSEAGVTKVRLISVTTNGSEEQILQGATDTLSRTEYVALADTGPEIHALSERFGFQNVAIDDRGFTSRRSEG